LVPVDAPQVDYLTERLLEAEPHEVPVIRDFLASHKDDLLDKLWAVLEKHEKGKQKQLLRAAAALATFDRANKRWAKASGLVADQLVVENPVFLGLWMEGFRPIKEDLLAPLETIYRNAESAESARSLAANILAEYADRPQTLADLLMDAAEMQFAVIFPTVKELGERGLSLLTAEIDKKLPPDLSSSDKQRENLGKRQANAAVALLRMNQPTKVWPLLKHSPDPRARSYLIHRLSSLGADAKAIVKRLDEESDLTIRRALILSLGEFGEKDFAPDERKALSPKLQEMYQTASDPGLHAALEWLLRTWKQEAWLRHINDEWAKGKVAGGAWRMAGKNQMVPPSTTHGPSLGWYVNSQGQTMVVIPGPVEFVMGSPRTEKDRNADEVQHKRRISRSIAIANTPVTLTHYRSLTKEMYEKGEKYNWHPDVPVVRIDWYMAAKYCNLLSKEEGIDERQWCYETDAKGQVTKLKANYLSLTGYRLPTEAEIEYATRAGAATSRYFGETDELLGHYSWFMKNANELIWPVGTKKPNDFGLFDTEGNCFTWCQEPYGDYPNPKGDEAVEDKEGKLEVVATDRRVLRGGSFDDPALNTRSANRFDNVPTNGNYDFGFRLVRTFPFQP